ncbi:MAG: response regulator [Bradymonadia bacterium]
MKTVLVVDPDVKSRQEIIGALPTKDVNTVEMEDGMDVLRYLKSNSVDVIISEVDLPFLGGLEFAKAVKQKNEYARTAIVFLTSKSDPMSMIQGIKAGAKQYLTKPIASRELGEKLSKLLGGR